MIKITLNPQTNPRSFAFDQDLIVIGEGSKETVDICFPAQGLHQNHLRIIKKGDGYWVINHANDPFVTYNGQSFGRKQLLPGDLLQIRDQVIQIEEISSLPASLESKELQSETSPYPDVDSLANDENPDAWFPSDISSMHPAETSEESGQKPVQPLTPTPLKHWKRRVFKVLLLSALGAFLLIGLTFIEVYFRAHQKSGKEEMWAAESLSDYAMALTYAKVYHIAPQKQNWVDPLFIKNNLADLLSTTSIVCGNIDAQGQFCNCPYLLRFYTNRDFSRFLLIAQPEPTLLQWLIPKATLLIDSGTMEIRMTQDLRTFNRLLSNPNPLDGSNFDELEDALQKTMLVSLNELSKTISKKEFSPPKALSYLKPGAENRIYNAPRYHQFSNTFLKKILSFTDQPLKNHDFSILQSELNLLDKFPDLVFYSDGGMQEALQGLRALKKLPLTHSYFTAYLLLSDQGNIVNSHIVMDSDHSQEVAFSVGDNPLPIAEAAPSTFNLVKEEEILEEKIKAHAANAQKSLQPLLLNLNLLLSETVDKENLNLPEHFFKLLNSYEYTKEKIRSDLQLSLDDFRFDYPHIDPLIIEKTLREYGLLDVFNDDSFLKNPKEGTAQTFPAETVVELK